MQRLDQSYVDEVRSARRQDLSLAAATDEKDVGASWIPQSFVLGAKRKP